jgi:cytochrome c oxidase subunit 4
VETSPHNPTLAEIDHAHGADHSGHVKTYWKVFFSLLVFTLIEYFYAHWYKDWFLVLVLGLMTWAVIKATLVGLYFMHLKYEGKWVFGMLVPAGILATIFVFALIPDVAMQPVTEINEPDDEGAAASPLSPRPTISEMTPEAKAGAPAHQGASH